VCRPRPSEHGCEEAPSLLLSHSQHCVCPWLLILQGVLIVLVFKHPYACLTARLCLWFSMLFAAGCADRDHLQGCGHDYVPFYCSTPHPHVCLSLPFLQGALTVLIPHAPVRVSLTAFPAGCIDRAHVEKLPPFFTSSQRHAWAWVPLPNIVCASGCCSCRVC
jgi:hypothetical protein